MSLLLAPFSALYGAVVRARMALYRAGALAAREVGVPVVSVGNLTAGGTGKTPLVGWVARSLAAEGRRVCVLSRGYRRADERRRVVVSDGGRLLADAREGGDEPRLLAEQLLGMASVVSDADRVAAARWAREVLGSDAFVLDDGFQHLRLARDFDVVTVDATDPWGGRRLLPRGRLREPLKGLARADCVVITRSDLAPDLAGLRSEVERLCGGRAAVLTARFRTRRLRPLTPGEDRGDLVDDGGPQPVAAFCAVGNPRAFFAHLRADGHELAYTRAFPDHHAYVQSDLDRLAREAESRGARALLTTAKDAVKLRALTPPLPCYVVDIEPEIDDEDTLLRLLREAVNKHQKK
jgi:tetraacyldisaccharide 4'-kinase